jgi:hypothetical protein
LPTTDPAPEWDWYDNTDLKIGEFRQSVHDWVSDEEVEELKKELAEKDRRRLPPDQIGFRVPPKPARKRRPRAK